MITATIKVAHKPRQRICPKSALTALTCDYLTALVVLAASATVTAPALPTEFSTANSAMLSVYAIYVGYSDINANKNNKWA